MVSFPLVSPPRPYTPPSSHPYAPHAQPISFFSILSPAKSVLLLILILMYYGKQTGRHKILDYIPRGIRRIKNDFNFFEKATVIGYCSLQAAKKKKHKHKRITRALVEDETRTVYHETCLETSMPCPRLKPMTLNILKLQPGISGFLRIKRRRKIIRM